MHRDIIEVVILSEDEEELEGTTDIITRVILESVAMRDVKLDQFAINDADYRYYNRGTQE